MEKIKKRIERCEKRIEKLKLLQAPNILIENEEKWLWELKKAKYKRKY